MRTLLNGSSPLQLESLCKQSGADAASKQHHSYSYSAFQESVLLDFCSSSIMPDMIT